MRGTSGAEEREHMKLYNTAEKLISPDYPYGYTMRTTKYDWLEFRKDKGFRHASQTINPKTGRENAPKRGVYCDILVLGKNEENNHTESIGFSFYAHEDINKIIEFLKDPAHFALFTPEQIEYIYLRFIGFCKINIVSQAQYCGSKTSDLLPLYDAQIDLLVQGAKSKGTKNVFSELSFDWEKIDSYKVAEYNPFRVTSYGA
jgi:hypothetical protein